MKILSFLIIGFISLLIISCNNNTSITQEQWNNSKNDMVNNNNDVNQIKINTKNNILSCNNVYITLNGSSVNNTNFIYGEEFQINFDNMSGFNNVEENIYPAMTIFVLNENNDTIFKTDDLYNGGYKTVDVSLNAYLKCADPMHSNGTYHAFVNIWDKKGKGTFVADFKFTVKPNDKIKVKPNLLTYNEIYLLSKDSKKVITNNKISLFERAYIVFEGLKGFAETDSMVNIGMNLVVTDINNDTVFYNPDFFPEQLKAKDVYDACYMKLFFKDKNIKTPLNCNVLIWDKKSDANLTAEFELNLIR